MFVDKNLNKRYDKLLAELTSVSEVFEDIESFVVEYVQTGPLEAFDSTATDAVRLLSWISSIKELSLEQQDYLSCHNARQSVEEIACRQRSVSVRFYNLRSLNKQVVLQRGKYNEVQLRLNPLRMWTRFATTVLLKDAMPPADVMFFADGSNIVSAVFEPQRSNLLSELGYPLIR